MTRRSARSLERRRGCSQERAASALRACSLLTFGFTAPDGGGYEVAWAKPGVAVGDGLKRVSWTKVAIE